MRWMAPAPWGAQQLLSAGKQVLDMHSKLGARVRLLAAGAVNKNGPNDARSVASAARAALAARREVRPDDHAGWPAKSQPLAAFREHVRVLAARALRWLL